LAAGWAAGAPAAAAARAVVPAAAGAAAARRAGAVPGFAAAAAAGPRAPWAAAAAAGLRSMSDAAAHQEAVAPAAEANPEHDFDPELLRALEIDHIPPAKIAETLRSENITIQQLKMLVDEGFHDSSKLQGGVPPTTPGEQAALSRNASEWSPEIVHQLNPRRRFFPGQTYLPEELSPNFQVDYVKLREEQRKLGCPLGGKKGPKIDYTNVSLLSRYGTSELAPASEPSECVSHARTHALTHCAVSCPLAAVDTGLSRKAGRSCRAESRWSAPRSRLATHFSAAFPL